MFKKLLILASFVLCSSSFANTVVLKESNTVYLLDTVTGETVTKVMLGIQKLNLDKTEEPIYLVLNTPGGSIFDGVDLIRFAKTSRRKIHTVTIFAASMGFQIVQALPGRRLITEGGVLMSHRGAVGGIGGQFPGELNSRLDFLLQVSKELDSEVAKRAGITLEEYEKLIHDEYYATPIKALAERFADEKVNVSCDSSLSGIRVEEVQTVFGIIEAQFSKCPLITSPLSIAFKLKTEKNKGVDPKQFIKSTPKMRNVTR
jgi:ATP-dependent Clp protease protease subunit